MYKIALLGVENSHATQFLNLIAAGKYPEIEVVGVYSNEPEAAAKLNEKFGVAILPDYAAAAGQVDGVMITARHGDNHYKYAKPYLTSGIPMFIDKPITCTEEDAVAFMTEAHANGVRLCGGSVLPTLPEVLELRDSVASKKDGTVLGGHLACPVQMSSVYGGFHFYSQHLVQMMTTIFGDDVRAVCANRREAALSFLARYDDYDVSGTFGDAIHYYNVSVYTSKGAWVTPCTTGPDSFAHEMDDMLALLRGEPMKTTYASFVRPVFVINALVRSADSGTWEPVHDSGLDF